MFGNMIFVLFVVAGVLIDLALYQPINLIPLTMNFRKPHTFILGFLLIMTATVGSSCTKTVCDDTCSYAYDGVCDDGGEGSSFSVCDCGTDCSDCGERKKGIGAAAQTCK